MRRFDQIQIPRGRRRTLMWGVIVIALLLTAAWLTPRLLDQSRWIRWSEQQASTAIGHAVNIGKISFHLLPRPGLDAEQISIANSASSNQAVLAKIDDLSMQFNLAGLLQRQFQVIGMQANGVQLNINADAAHPRYWTSNLLTPQINPAPQSAHFFDGLTAVDVRNMTLHFVPASSSVSTTAIISQWQIDRLHVDTQPFGRDMRFDAAITHQQQVLTVRGSADRLTAPTRAQLVIDAAPSSIRIDLQQAPLKASAIATSATAATTPAPYIVQIDARRLDRLLSLFKIDSLPIAPLQLNATVQPQGKQFDVTKIAANLGELKATGSAQIDLAPMPPAVRAQLQIPRLDWIRMLADAGRPPVADPPAGELFRTHRLPWRVLAAASGVQADIDLKIGTLKTRSGVELIDASARFLINDGQLRASAMQAQMLGGAASGTLHLIGAQQSAQLKLQLRDVSLQKGLQSIGRASPLTGGTLQMQAVVSARGESMKALAASLTGPVSVTLGPTDIASSAGARSEEMLTGLLPYFSARDAQQIRLECASVLLPFQNGRASANPLIGVRSQASQLLTQGDLDLRSQSLDVHGRVRARSRLSLGLSALSGDIRISGPLVKPRAKLDPVGSPSAAARVGAAIVTGGLSVVGTALWDTISPGTDACAAVAANKAVVAQARGAQLAQPSRSQQPAPGAKAIQ